MNGKDVYSKVVRIDQISDIEKTEMLKLMKEFYDNVLDSSFNHDLEEKDYCIILYNEDGMVKGFSTQKEISFKVNGKIINGIFSGDTIIHKDYWGSLELLKKFARTFVKDKNEEYYWFLISKGYKTYRMLPLFFDEFYPNYKSEIPKYEKEIMDVFGNTYYPLDYNKINGVMEYKGIKDKLKDGVADITEKELKDKNIKYFTEINPGYINGEDLMCLARLDQDNLSKTAKRLFRGV